MYKSTYKNFAIIHESDFELGNPNINTFKNNAVANGLPSEIVQYKGQAQKYFYGAVFFPSSFKSSNNITGVSYRNYKAHFVDNIVNMSKKITWNREIMSDEELQFIMEYIEEKIQVKTDHGCSRFFYVNTYVTGRGWMWGKFYLAATTEFEAIENSGVIVNGDLSIYVKGNITWIEKDGIDLNSVSNVSNIIETE